VPATNLYKAAQTLAALEMSRGNARAAEALWEQLRGEFPELIVPRLELAARYQRTRRRDEARVVIQEALAVNPALTTAALRQHGLFSTRRDVDALLASLQAAGLPSL